MATRTSKHSTRRRVGAFYRVTAGVLAAVVFLTLGTPLAAQAQEHREASESRAAAEVAGRSAAEDLGHDAPLSEEVTRAIGEDLEYRDEVEGLEGVDPETLEAAEAGVDAAAAAAADLPEGAEAAALPSGEASSAVTPQAISLPNAEGSIEGMGESFAPVLSSGTGTFSVPIALPAGRGGVQPSLGLSYSSSGGNTCVGFGWAFGTPFIARQTDRGLPRYIDDTVWHEEEDRFIYNGGQELVPVDTAAMATVDDSGHGYGAGNVPSDVTGWQQYRARVEGGFLRFFRDPAGERWVVQGKDGTRFDFGLLPAGEGPMDLDATNALQTELDDPDARVYQWFLTRMSDAHGSTVYYRYVAHEGYRYLADVHYLSPASCSPGPAADPAAARACGSNLTDYGVRVAMTYEARQDVFSNYVPGWRVENGLRLKRVTVLAAGDTVGSRELVRRYHLTYDPTSYHSLLSSVQVEGRPDAPDGFGAYVTAHVAEDELSIPFEERGGVAMLGRLLPAMTFDYTTMPTGGPSIPGFGGVDNTARTVTASPNVSVDAARADLFDVNTDGLPDLIVTDPARYRMADGSPAVGVFFNGFSGPGARPAGEAAHFSDPVSVPMPAGLSGTLNLSNANIVPMDVDGDGRSDLLHMPRLDRYGYFTPSRTADAPGGASSVSPADQGWAFGYVDVELPRVGDDPRIDFVRDATHYKVFDVNNDHLIDVVRTTGTVMQTWLNLGWVPGGEGKFGQASWTGTEWDLSTDPLETCLLHDGTPIDFGDPEVRLSDMNGDGIQDIVRIRRGDITWWPGRGAGVWGDGSASCRRGEGDAREITVATPPRELNPDLSGVFLTDVNGDGATDVVQVRFRELDVWFSRGGESFTDRITVDAPMAPDFAPRIRFADIDGSATTDLIYGNADNWQYLDLMGGLRPRLLRTVHNGLGAETTMAYASSADDYVQDLVEAESCSDSTCERFTWSHVPDTGCDAKLADAGVGASCYRSGGSPVVSTIIREVSTNDHFGSVGSGNVDNVTTTRFAYHDGYYEGIEQEFRGFGAADAESVGDELSSGIHPTQWTRTFFHQGRRPSAIASERLADNPREALKGRQWMSETTNHLGEYLSSSHATCTVRKLATGQDGRSIYYAYVSRSDALSYDTMPFVPDGHLLPDLPVAVYETVDAAGTPGPDATIPDEFHDVAVRGGGWAWIRGTTDEVDNVGNVRQQTALGRVRDPSDTVDEPGGYNEDIRSVSVPVLINDAGQYIWRTASGYVDGHNTDVPLGVTSNTFNGVGDLSRSTQAADLPASSNYDFSGDTLGAAGYTQGNQTLEASTQYDAWGSATASCAGADLGAGAASSCLRYAEVDYDAAYAQLPETERVAVNQSTATHCAASAGFCMLATTATWDRGFGVLNTATDPNAQVSTVTYDGLGRMTSMTPPAFDGCSSVDGPAQRIEYELVPGGEAYSYVTTYTNEGTDGGWTYSCNGDTFRRSYSFVDGLGRTRAALEFAESGRWVRAGHTRLTSRGQPYVSCNPVGQAGSISTLDFDFALTGPDLSTEECATQAFDGFSRPISATERDGSVSKVYYHALSTEAWDANDLGGAEHFLDTQTIRRTDGHGRAIDQVLINRQYDPVLLHDREYYRLITEYRADNAVITVTRGETANGDPLDDTTLPLVNAAGRFRILTRDFTYDTAGRRIGSTDPDSDSRTEPGGSGRETWRYLFNRVGDLAAVRDPRGCGQNFYYDHAGRLVGERYVSCGEAQPAGDSTDETLPSDAIGMERVGSGSVDVDVLNYFDEPPPFHASSMTTAAPAAPTANFALGRLTGTSDRGQRTAVFYDQRGQVSWTGRQMAILPAAGTGVPASYATLPTTPFTAETHPAGTRQFDEAHTYVVVPEYNYIGETYATTLPQDPDYGTGAPVIRAAMRLGVRGLPVRTELQVDGAVNYIARDIRYEDWGGTTNVYWGRSIGSAPLMPTAPLQQAFTYDARLRLVRDLVRHYPDGSVPLTGARGNLDSVITIQDHRYTWDATDNLVRHVNILNEGEWPEGHHGREELIHHDALYRVADVELGYNTETCANVQGTAWGWCGDDPFEDWRGSRDATRAVDPMRTNPAPMLPAEPSHRPNSFVYEYDWLGNQVEWTDGDLGGGGVFYERSIGENVGNGFDDPGYNAANPRPAALYLSSNLGTSAPTYSATADRGGWVTLDYGDSGNLIAMTARARCRDVAMGNECYDDPALSYTAREAHLEAHCECDGGQYYEYRWDELNRLTEARRYDKSAPASWELAVRQRYRYDGGNMRTVKQTFDDDDPDTGLPIDDRYALYVYPGDYERSGVAYDVGTGTYVADATLGTETQYLVSGARITWKATTTGNEIDRNQRIALSLTNLIQSTTAVVDLLSGRLMEAGTFYPNGARETRIVNDVGGLAGAGTFSLEPMGFTGKEADEEVGLVYFGMRYLVPRVGRWASPDPLQVFAGGGGEFGNSYHYVAGNLLQARDPNGLFPWLLLGIVALLPLIMSGPDVAEPVQVVVAAPLVIMEASPLVLTTAVLPAIMSGPDVAEPVEIVSGGAEVLTAGALALGRRQARRAARRQARRDAELVEASRAAGDAAAVARPGERTSGTSTAFRDANGEVHTGLSTGAQGGTPHDLPGAGSGGAEVAARYEGIPRASRGASHQRHGRICCSEAGARQTAAQAGAPQAGGEMATTQIEVRGSGHRRNQHGTFKESCGSCGAVNGQLGTRAVTDPVGSPLNPTPPRGHGRGGRRGGGAALLGAAALGSPPRTGGEGAGTLNAPRSANSPERLGNPR